MFRIAAGGKITQDRQGREGKLMEIGLRERRKAEKVAAITKAARELFMTHGFHETPMREVARLADVGFGTVSAYATDKAGLAAMLFVEDLERLEPLFTTVDPDASMLDQVMAYFSTTFRFWASKPELSRIVLPKLGNTINPYVATILKRRSMLRASMISWLFQAKQARRVSADCNIEQAAELLFALYIGSVNEWLSSGLDDVQSGIDRLRYLIEIPVNAFERTR
ncbi:TetR/AcrR family transcriptional regulator [Glacieibacterium megasporae]|uniref:TetR/AcrR family transcriptional regulator n=1 Tax=Glacieibacterium megasporae TaxID=2835787 RepID=UPI001C1E7A2B|nr:TetR/AcrR family transcriptional regulator [Polymorphobacter megasporae]UAJ10516.1 TetR/AcrR family transcriptional regulator [Polymorphobacter megasporae]